MFGRKARLVATQAAQIEHLEQWVERGAVVIRDLRDTNQKCLRVIGEMRLAGVKSYDTMTSGGQRIPPSRRDRQRAEEMLSTMRQLTKLTEAVHAAETP